LEGLQVHVGEDEQEVERDRGNRHKSQTQRSSQSDVSDAEKRTQRRGEKLKMEWTELMKLLIAPAFIAAVTVWMQFDRSQVKKAITSLEERVSQGFKTMERILVTNDFESELIKAEAIWYQMDRVLNQEETQIISSQLQKRIKEHVQNFFHDIASTDFTYEQYEYAERKIEALIKIEKEQGRIGYPCFSEDYHVVLDQLMLFRTSQVMSRLETLANDNIHNAKMQRLQTILLEFYTGYRADIIKFLFEWEKMR
jgi:cell division protein FtsL